ncbi:MAG: NAD(P)/FAD-dependent oxidoreductase [Gracilibacteraceae bacterium]|nr:NAD(P)/FAD-dependent oxidoreductase [Gracilibacteraceae bacterium]
MAQQYDVIMAGGGHNGLTVACYLAKAGLSVCVVEQSDKVGGAVISRELIPGFISDPCSTQHHIAQFSPTLRNDDLGLISKYGLKYIFPEEQECVIFSDNTTFNIYIDVDKTCQEIAKKFSEKDAEAYRKFYDWACLGVNAIVQGFFTPPMPYGMYASMMDSSDEGRELLRAGQMSCYDVLNEWFDNEKLKIGMLRWISEIMVNPKTAGTGVTAFTFIGLAHMKPGCGMPVGGSGRLSEVMEAFIKDHGGTILTNSLVKEFIVANGEAKGVRLAGGEEILAKRMCVADLHVKQIFPHMVSGAVLPDGYTKKVQRLRHASYMAFQQSVALKEDPQFTCKDPSAQKAFFVEFAPDNMVDFLRMFDELEYGIPGLAPLVSVPTIHDPSRAPAGKHIMYLYEYAPYKRLDGKDWDDVREDFADEVYDYVAKYSTNMTRDNIIGRYIMSPKDLERVNPSMINGDIGHLGAYTEQFLGNRPLPYYNYKTPVDKLMMCGPSTHPGCGVTCGGRAAAMAILEELGFLIDDVVK